MRCPARHPVHPEARCEEAVGHLDEQKPHFNSFFMRSWEEPEQCGLVTVTAGAGMTDQFVCVLPEFHPGDHDFAGADR